MASESIPTTSRQLTAPSYGLPSSYVVSERPTPTIFSPKDVLVKVHSGSINPIDVVRVKGDLKIIQKFPMPLELGYDFSGTVVQAGAEATSFKIGDEVFGMLGDHRHGSIADYICVSANSIAHKPKNISHNEAGSLGIVGFTTVQAFDYANELVPGGLKGKTVLVPAALSGTGSMALQLAKNVFEAGKVISTASTSKIPRVPELLGKDTVDQLVDYVKGNVLKEVQPGSVDFLFDTVGLSMAYLPLLKPKTGVIISISTLPSGSMTKCQFDQMPKPLEVALNIVDWVYRWRAGRRGVKYTCFAPTSEYEGNTMKRMSKSTAGANDMERLAKWIEEGKVRAVVGRMAKLSDLQDVKNGCEQIVSRKGGVGKFVIEIA